MVLCAMQWAVVFLLVMAVTATDGSPSNASAAVANAAAVVTIAAAVEVAGKVAENVVAWGGILNQMKRKQKVT